MRCRGTCSRSRAQRGFRTTLQATRLLPKFVDQESRFEFRDQRSEIKGGKTVFHKGLDVGQRFGQASPSKSDRSATKETAITDSEKSAWEAYKNKQADAFKKYLATDYNGVYADGVKNVDKEVADMEKSELRDYSLADMKVVFPSADVAVTTYKATLQGSSGGAGYIGYVQRRQRLGQKGREMARYLSH